MPVAVKVFSICLKTLMQHVLLRELPRWLSGKESPCQCSWCRTCGFSLWLRKIPWRRKWQPTPVFLPGKSRGQRSMEGYSPLGCKESDTTEQHFPETVLLLLVWHERGLYSSLWWISLVLTKVLLVLKSNLPIINVMIIKSFLPQMSNLPVFCMTVTCPNIIGWIIRFYLLIGNFLTFMCHVHHSFLSTSFVISFSRGSFWPRDQTWVSCIASRFITIWATREASIC